MSTQKVFITGCAKSGTTLLKRLFYSFNDVFITPKEGAVSDFPQWKDCAEKTVVIKRDSGSIFSSSLGQRRLKNSITIILASNLKIVNIFRDGRDVVFGQKPYLYKSWIYSIRMMKVFHELIACNIKYEDLVNNPDEEQKKVARSLGLTRRYKFSEYPNFVPEQEFIMLTGPSYKKRPIMNNRISKNLDSYKKLCPSELINEFNAILRYLGYLNA